MRVRTSTRPTALGWRALVFAAAIFAAFWAAPYTNLYFLMLCLLAALAALGAVWTHRNLVGLDGEVFAIEPTPAGAGGEVHVHLDPGRRARFGVGVSVRTGKGTHAVLSVTELRSRVALSGRLPGLPRGVHGIVAAWVESSWPFGLLRSRRPLSAPVDIVVYPAPAELPALASRQEILAALGGVAGGDHGPSGVREFRPGDDPRHIDWKATARRADLMLKEMEAEGARGIELCVDRRTSEPSLEAALSVVAALAELAREHKEPLALHTQGLQATFGPGQRTWDELWRHLAAAATLPPGAPPPPAVSPHVLHLPRRDER